MKLAIGENLKRLRRGKGVTQEELSDFLGISAQAVSRWENDLAYPDIELLPELASFFDVSMEQLMGTDRSRETLRSTLCEMDPLTPEQAQKSLNRLRRLAKQFPDNWEIRERIGDALLALGEEEWERAMPELRYWGNEAKLKYDWNEIRAIQWFLRTLMLIAPEEEAGEWSDALNSSPYNTMETNKLLRYTDYRKDPDKAQHWQGQLIFLYTQILANEFRNPFQTPEGDINQLRMQIRLYDAIAGIPYEKDGVVHNTLFLSQRAQLYIDLVIQMGAMGMDNKALETLKVCVDYLCLYADSLGQDRLTADNLYFDRKAPYTVHRREYDLIDQGMKLKTCMFWEPQLGRIRKTEAFRKQMERLQAKQTEVNALWGDRKTQF